MPTKPPAASSNSDTKYDYTIHDAQVQKKWTREKTYQLDTIQRDHIQNYLQDHPQDRAQTTKTHKVFTIDTPPPTISGALHIGHIFSYTHTDIIARYKRLSGYTVFYPFGFDDNGLPTERFVEKKHKITAAYLGRSAFIALCSRESQEIGKIFAELWQKLGISADWSQTYSTISPFVRAISQASFLDLYHKNFVYRKEDPALYCTTCRTTVAQAELDDADIASHFFDITFSTSTGKIITIATTRPELLSSCVALFYNPTDIRYQKLEKQTALVPIFGYQVPILADEAVDQAKGTGLVMCCTFGDKQDIIWYKTHNLAYRQSIQLDGTWAEHAGILAGLKAHNAREKIIEALVEQAAITNKRPITHAVNIHERCKKEIEYVIIKQWFLKILEHKQLFLQLADKINWYPPFMKSRYKDWVEHLQWDWCLSRQRYYGIPFPVWHCNNCSAILVPTHDQLPIDPQEKSYPGGTCSCGSNTISPDTDVMDTWNTSSLSPYICAALFKNKITQKTEKAFDFSEQESHTFLSQFLPMSIRPQAHDIIRTWAFYTIIKTWMHNKTIPWENIIISGHVLSSEKDKISKSQSNSTIEPENLLKLYPADTIRFWTASGTLGQDTAFSETQLKIGNKLLTKLWNAFRFIEPHCVRINTQEKPQVEKLASINKWLLHNMSICFAQYQEYFEKQEYNLALATIERFFWEDFCDNYLEIIKDQFFNSEKYNPELVTQTTEVL